MAPMATQLKGGEWKIVQAHRVGQSGRFVQFYGATGLPAAAYRIDELMDGSVWLDAADAPIAGVSSTTATPQEDG